MSSTLKSYQDLCALNKIEQNPKQLELIEKLDIFTQKNKLNFFQNINSLIFKKNNNQCFYIYGKVGSGKTLIMDLFFQNLNNQSIQRIHFYEFMINTHNNLHKLRKHKDKKNFLLLDYAKNIAKKTKLIFFDEFQITNIADAMILGQLFTELFKQNIKIVLTSNNSPDDLYKDGLQRELFIPFIELIKDCSVIYNLDSGTDYRKNFLNIDEVFFCPLSNSNNLKINNLYDKLSEGKDANDLVINIKSREFTIKNLANKVARFDFNEICGDYIGAEDYINITEYIKFLIIDNVENFSDENADKQARFINLIDILYDHKIGLIMSCEKKVSEMKIAFHLKDKFKRTLSRLSEMESVKYRNLL